MKKLFLILGFILIAVQALAADYYIRTDGTAVQGSTTGCDSASTAMSLATFEGGSFLADDVFYFCNDGSYIDIDPPRATITLDGQPSGQTTRTVIDADGADYGVSSNRSTVTWQNFEFKNAAIANFHFFTATGLTVSNCYFHTDNGSDGYGIRLYNNNATSVNTITITGCTFQNLDQDGIIIYHGASTAADFHTITITKNDFIDLVDSTNRPTGINTFYSDMTDLATRRPYDITVTYNKFLNISGDAMNIYAGPGGGSAENLIAYNHVRRMGVGNLVRCNAIQTHYLANTTIEHNYVKDVFTSGPGDGCGIIVDWADSDGDGTGEHTYDSQGVIVRYNEVTGCKNTTGGAQPSGILAYGADDTEVYGNIVYGNYTGIGHTQTGTTGTIIQDNLSFKNTHYNYRARATSVASTLRRNVSYGSQYGISIQSGGSGFSTEEYNQSYGASVDNYDNITEDSTSSEGDFLDNKQFWFIGYPQKRVMRIGGSGIN